MRKISILFVLLLSIFTLVGCKKDKESDNQLFDIDKATYNNIMRYNDYDLGYYIVVDDEKYGLYDENGEEVLAPVYDYLFPPTNGTIAFYLDGNAGVIDLNGNTIIPAEYEVVLPGHSGLYPAMDRGRWGFINEDNEIAIEFIYDSIDGLSFINDYASVVSGGQRYFIDQEGEELLTVDIFVDVMYGKGVFSTQNNNLYDLDTLELIEGGDRLQYYSSGYAYYATKSSVLNSDNEIVHEYDTDMYSKVIGNYLVYKDSETEEDYYFNLETGETDKVNEDYPVFGVFYKKGYLYNPDEDIYYLPDGHHCVLDNGTNNHIGNEYFYYKKDQEYVIRNCDAEVLYETQLQPLQVNEDKLVLYNENGMEVIDLDGNVLFENDYQPVIYHVDYTMEYIIGGEHIGVMFNEAFYNNRLLVTDTEKVYVMDDKGELVIDEGFDAIFRTDTILFSILYNHPYLINWHRGYNTDRLYVNVAVEPEEINCEESPFHPDCIENVE